MEFCNHGLVSLPTKKSILALEGLQIELVQKKIKNVSIRVCPPEGRILVSAPLHFSHERILTSLRPRVEWMGNHQRKFLKRQQAALLIAETRPPVRSREALVKELSFLVEKWSIILNVNVSSWSIRQMKSRWGSCHVKEHRIVFNLELAKHTLARIEYVVAHELIHLIEPSHNARFKRFMTEAIPNWKELNRELSLHHFL